MAKVLNLGKVVGSNGKDATINGQNTITLDGSNGITIMTESDGVVTVDGNGIKTELTTHTYNTDIHVTAEEKAAWNGKAELSDIPTTLPANGGNADTLDGLHASDFMQNLGCLTTGSLLDYVLTMTVSGSLFITGDVTDTPVSGLFYGVDVIRHRAGDYVITATRFNGGGVWTNRYNSDAKKWYGWANVADGGDADTVDGKHASEFMQFLGDIRTGSLLDYISSLDKSGFLYCGGANCTDMPVDGTYFIVEVHYYATVKEVKATSFSTGAVYTNRYSGSRWLGWHGVADGGNADTVDGLHANEIASNPNLLDNPDFKINQRELTSYSYTTNGFTVDRWKINNNSKLTVNDGFVTFENTTEKAVATLFQIVENPAAFSGKTVTLSFDYDLKSEGASITIQALVNGSWTTPVSFTSTGRNVQSNVIALPENLTELRLALVIHSTDSAPLAIVDVYGAKLELGSLATPFTPPNPATELAKCQRYFNSLFVDNGIPVQFIGSGIAPNDSMATILVNLPTVMRSSTPTVSLTGTLYLSGGNHTAENSIAVQGISGSYLDRNVLQLNLTSNATLDRTVAYLLSRRDTNTALTVSAEL